MAAEPFGISNPKGNNRDLVISAVDAEGCKKQIAFLKPGESYRSSKPNVTVEEKPRPPRLMLDAEGNLARDTRPGGPTFRQRNRAR